MSSKILTERKIEAAVQYMAAVGHSVGATEVSKQIHASPTRAREILNMCVDRGLAKRKLAGKKKFAGNPLVWEGTGSLYVAPAGESVKNYSFSGLLSAWGIKAPGAWDGETRSHSLLGAS